MERKPVVVDLIADMLHQFSPLLARERLRYSSRNDAVLLCQFIRAKDGAGLRLFANRGYPIHNSSSSFPAATASVGTNRKAPLGDYRIVLSPATRILLRATMLAARHNASRHPG